LKSVYKNSKFEKKHKEKKKQQQKSQKIDSIHSGEE